MKTNYSTLMQSRFFNPAFNSAIFDGPLRIYFAQAYESSALKVYFGLQQKFSGELELAKKWHQSEGANLLIMLYPSKESYSMSCDGDEKEYFLDHLAGDEVIGFSGPIEDNQLDQVLNSIASCLRKWSQSSSAAHEAVV